MKKSSKQDQIRYFQKRIDHLEKANRLTLEALDLALNLGQFEKPINTIDSSSVILTSASERFQQLIPFECFCFYLTDESDSSFKKAFCSPELFTEYMQHQIDHLIQARTLAWALDRSKPIIVLDAKREKRLLIHTLETSSRTRGIFVGVPQIEEQYIPDITLSVFSIIIHSTAYALESYELYKWANDINRDLKEKVDRLVSSERDLKRSERLLKDAQRITQTGCWEYSLKTGEMYWSDELYMLLGYGPGDVLPTYERIVGHIHPDDRKQIVDRMEQYKVDVPVVTDEYRIVTKDGQEKHIFSQMQYEFDESGEFVSLRGTLQDCTLLKQEEKEKEKLRLQLQQSEKMKTVGILAGGVAHDLNNILGGIVGYPELLLKKLPKDSPLVRPLQLINQSGERAASIVNDLLTLARRGVSVSEVININDLIEEYLSSYQCENLKHYHPGLTIVTNLESEPFNITGSSVHILKAAMNLISNAAEAMHEGGTVKVSTKNVTVIDPIRGFDYIIAGQYVVLSVADTGIGISEKDMKKIFEPFYTKKVMGRSGTGLGMAVVWSTVKDHEGYIDLTSDCGKGSRFDLYFPVTDRESAPRKESLPLQAYTGKGQSILVVDDVEEQRELALSFLEELRYKAEAVSSGEEAVAHLKIKLVDLVIIDMIMEPGMDGLDTYKKIIAIHPGQKAIIASGFSETDRVKEALKLGAGQYIKKPYNLEKIGIALARELEK